MGKIDESFVKELREDFLSSPKNLLALNVCTRYDPAEAAVQRSELCSTTAHHVFTNKVEAEGKPVSNQRSSGRCWIFAVLNVARLPFCKKYTLDDFEFSQAYLFFWDKIERCNFFLHKIVELLRKGEKPSGRLLSFLLDSPQGDAGQWDMVVDIVNKYGLVPKKVFPESFSCEKSVVLNGFLNGKLKEFAKDLDILVEKGGSDADAHVKIRDQMKVVYRIVSICLGVPPTSFDWEYVDKEKQHHRISGITPLEFYNQYVKPLFNVDDKMCIVNDPRKTSGFGRPLLVEHLGNVVGGRETVYNNQEIEVLMRGVRDSIRANEAVWFGCHVSTYFFRKNGILSTKIRDFKLLFDEDYSLSMSKADRLIYGQSQMTHAMVFTGISCGEGDQLPTKFRVENSWGEDCGEKGYLVMTDDWFREFVYEVVVDKKFLSKEVLDAFDGARVVLPPWDPMGALAN